MQIFYKAPADAGLSNGTVFTVNLDFVSDVAGNITVNGVVTEMVVGENHLVVPSNTSASDNAADLSVQFGVNGGEIPANTTMISAANIKFSNISFTF